VKKKFAEGAMKKMLKINPNSVYTFRGKAYFFSYKYPHHENTNNKLHMRKWHLKAIIQKFIALLPFSQRLNYFFQKYITKGLVLTEDLFMDRFGHALEHIEAYQTHQKVGKPLHEACELGTGWYPIVPFAMYLYGAKRIVTTDIDKLCTTPQCIALAKMYIKQHAAGQLPNWLTQDEGRLQTMRTVAESNPNIDVHTLLKMLHIEYIIADLTQAQLWQPFDLVHSNNTFEHVYPEILSEILKNLHKLTKKGGIMSHFIDLSDHYAHMDGSINIYNFLRYSDRQWKWIDNSVQPMNRYRMPDYRAIYAQLSIPILAEKNRPGNLTELAQIPLDVKYQKNTAAENAISHSYVVS
jgi:Methyltransferase domain